MINISIGRGFEYGVLHIKVVTTLSLSEIFDKIQEHLHEKSVKNINTCENLEGEAFKLDFSPEELILLGSLYLNGERLPEETSLKLDLNPEDYLRVHTKPRRFPYLDSPQVQALVNYETEDFIVMEKPSGVPTHPSVDNTQENLLSFLEKTYKKDFFITHRLDVPTQGLILFAKNTKFQNYFNQLLIQRNVQKIYQALVENKWESQETQRLEHWMIKHPRAPKILTVQPEENTVHCELNVLKGESHPFTLEGAEFINPNLTNSSIQTSLLEIELLTGRTHQIRAQLSHVGFPIIGDVTYGSSVKLPTRDHIFLRAHYLNFEYEDQPIRLISKSQFKIN